MPRAKRPIVKTLATARARRSSVQYRSSDHSTAAADSSSSQLLTAEATALPSISETTINEGKSKVDRAGRETANSVISGWIEESGSSSAPTEINPAQRVFDIAELLEAILLCLPGDEIAKARRVQRQFNGVFLGSRKLRCMFTEPRPVTELVRVPEWNHLFTSRDHTLIGMPGIAVVGTVHPALVFKKKVLSLCIPATLDNQQPITIISVNTDKASKWHTGPWRDHFFTQPPCDKVKLCFHLVWKEYPNKDKWVEVKRGGGVRLADIWDAIREIQAEETQKKQNPRAMGVEYYPTIEIMVEGFVPEDSAIVKRARRSGQQEG